MDISKQLDEIIELLKGSGLSDYIAIFSVFVAVIALIVNIAANRRNHRQYIESLKPLLSFGLYEINGILFLSIKNMGQTEARNIKVNLLELKNNGDYDLESDDLFKMEFMLYPMEEVQGRIATYGGNCMNDCFPVVDVKISFLNGNDNKISEYSRSITFKRIPHEKINLSRIEESIESVSYSNNRLANYIEGRTLFRFDKLNVHPHNSLYKDMKDAFNNIEREESKNKNTDKER